MSARQWTLRICQSCGATKADAPEFTVCSGPHCGPFPTDHSHKPTVTDVVVVQEAEPILWARDEALRSAAKWRAAFDHVARHLDADDLNTVAVLDEAERCAVDPEPRLQDGGER